jgi:hypothetical protein
MVMDLAAGRPGKPEATVFIRAHLRPLERKT